MPGTGNMLSPTIQPAKFFQVGADVTKSANYTVLLSDCGTMFLTGGAANITFTLPALAAGTNFWAVFFNTQGNNMVISAPSGKLMAFNNAAATSVTYSTASALIGACSMVWMNDAGTFYNHAQWCSNTVTIA